MNNGAIHIGDNADNVSTDHASSPKYGEAHAIAGLILPVNFLSEYLRLEEQIAQLRILQEEQDSVMNRIEQVMKWLAHVDLNRSPRGHRFPIKFNNLE
jgi:hypothetical protein